MRITDLLKPESIGIGGAPASKDEAIDELVDLMAKGGNVADKAGYAAAVREREAQFSTGLGDGIAIPHAKTAAVSAPGLAAMTVPAGVDYQSLDGEPATSYTFAMDYYWMMGDNRHNSADSRFWGFVPEDHIVGKASFVWLSLDAKKSFPSNIRWSRMFRKVR